MTNVEMGRYFLPDWLAHFMSQGFALITYLAIIVLWLVLLAITIAVPLKISMWACQWYYGNCNYYHPANPTAVDVDGTNFKISSTSSLSTSKTISMGDGDSLGNACDDDDDMIDVEL